MGTASKEITQKNENISEKFTATDDFMARAGIEWGAAMSDDAEDTSPTLEFCRQHQTITTSLNRPSSATRPGTAPALYTLARSSHYVGPEVISRTSTSGSGTTTTTLSHSHGLDAEPTSDIELPDDSPFAFNVPGIADVQPASYLPSSPPINIANPRDQFPNATVWDVCGSWP
jgi:hypothetical protein